MKVRVYHDGRGHYYPEYRSFFIWRRLPNYHTKHIVFLSKDEAINELEKFVERIKEQKMLAKKQRKLSGIVYENNFPV